MPLSKLRQHVDQILTRVYEIRRVFLKYPGPVYRWRLYRAYRRIARGWLDDFGLRIEDVRSAKDNERISPVPNAGEIIDGKLIMHNGITISPGSYVDDRMTQLLQQNRAVHEPQEEAAFEIVLGWLKERRLLSYTMIELGSYWAFYSLWFKVFLPTANCYCVEPDETNLQWGQKNFEINGQAADFTHAYVSSAPAPGNPPTISVDSFAKNKQIEHVDILHSDIQGFELQMLQGAAASFRRRMIDYVFISTHRHALHYRCIDKLKSYGFRILASADLLESHSLDGLIVAVRDELRCPPKIAIHHRTPK